MLDRPTDAPTDPAELVEGRMSAQDAIRQLAAHLSPDPAEIVVLRVVAGLSAEDVGAVVGKTPGAVRVARTESVSLDLNAEWEVLTQPSC